MRDFKLMVNSTPPVGNCDIDSRELEKRRF